MYTATEEELQNFKDLPISLGDSLRMFGESN